MKKVFPPKVALARNLRKTATQPEILLWERLKDRKVSGFAFRRQHPLGPYILDFYCPRAKLAVEVDGGFHDNERDEVRDEWVLSQGVNTYRIPAADVFRDPYAAADGVRLLAEERLRIRKQETPPPRA